MACLSAGDVRARGGLQDDLDVRLEREPTVTQRIPSKATSPRTSRPRTSR